MVVEILFSCFRARCMDGVAMLNLSADVIIAPSTQLISNGDNHVCKQTTSLLTFYL